MRLFILSVNNKIGGVERLTIDSIWILVFLLVATVAVLFYMYFLYRMTKEDKGAEERRRKCKEKYENELVVDSAIIQGKEPVRRIGQHKQGITGREKEIKLAEQIAQQISYK